MPYMQLFRADVQAISVINLSETDRKTHTHARARSVQFLTDTFTGVPPTLARPVPPPAPKVYGSDANILNVDRVES